MAASTDSTNSTIRSDVEVSNPYFLSSSDNPSTILVSKVFDGSGFSTWKRSMTLALSAKNKLGFVDGSLLPPEDNPDLVRSWNRVNSMIISWILNSLSKDIAESVLFLQTAREIWSELIQRYSQSNGALIYQIQKQLYSINQGSEDFSTYFTKIKKVWDELRMIQEIPACSCSSAAVLNKFMEDQRLIQLLMGLNDSYKVIRGQILMMTPLPSIVTVHSLLIHEERQREISSNPNIVTEAMAMHVLKHPAIRVFLTHSGWNSTIESISSGAPVICWPFFAEQQTNCRYSRVEWGIGMEINTNLKREELEAQVREMMDGKKGEIMKNKALELKKKAQEAVAIDGSSYINFEKLINDMLLKK